MALRVSLIIGKDFRSLQVNQVSLV